MLPPHYPNNRPHHYHHHGVYQQDQPFLPNPTATAAAAFLMPATAMSWDGYGAQIFPADMFQFHHQEDTLEAVLQQQPVTVTAPLQTAASAGEMQLRRGEPVADPGAGVHAAGAPRKRPFRTDRHSKIRTAQGVRDRRMRLSVGVAREFFALQDRLGFDKASKTVNWLLTQSKPAIDCLRDAAKPAAGSGAPTVLVKGRGEGSSSSTCCFMDSREKTTENRRSRAGRDGPPALMEEQNGGEQMDGLEYYYQYCLQLQEMMRCNGVSR